MVFSVHFSRDTVISMLEVAYSNVNDIGNKYTIYKSGAYLYENQDGNNFFHDGDHTAYWWCHDGRKYRDDLKTGERVWL